MVADSAGGGAAPPAAARGLRERHHLGGGTGAEAPQVRDEVGELRERQVGVVGITERPSGPT
jgi:hypothetical protein